MPDKHGQPFRFRTKWESKKSRCLQALAALTPLELAYLAGIIDGEGTISFRKMQKGYYRPILEITNTDPLLIEHLHKFFWQTVVSARNARQVPYLRVNLTGFGIAPVLEALDSYLIGKQLQARLVRNYIALRQEQRWKCPPSEEMLAIYREVRALNSHGPESIALKQAVRRKYSSI